MLGIASDILGGGWKNLKAASWYIRRSVVLGWGDGGLLVWGDWLWDGGKDRVQDASGALQKCSYWSVGVGGLEYVGSIGRGIDNG